jgi:hypothetical protein
VNADETRDGEQALRLDIRDAVRVGDDDALASLVERLREMRFIEVRRVLEGLDTRQLRRVAETAISLPPRQNVTG